ncbi:hypothetical protein KNP65_03680 [Latilactobacillus curvatus]|uniref:hypothetical protein n=1 Tax=Latilactobacillus curvatus TaxID=28038 RepID=UPI00241105A4|nr:hypothetical protein [Latilactobacillus curvatus]MDG2979038.1 hypothetical protein [Latilactobacillus curvatus]
MSTTSYIFTESEGTSYKGVSVHFDGELTGVGATLQTNYTDAQKVMNLVELGEIMSLGASLEPCEAVDRFGSSALFTDGFRALSEPEQTRQKEVFFSGRYTVAYHRDGGEKLKTINYKNALALMNDLKYSYDRTTNVYLFQNKKWFYLDLNEYKWCELAPKLEDGERKELA